MDGSYSIFEPVVFERRPYSSDFLLLAARRCYEYEFAGEKFQQVSAFFLDQRQLLRDRMLAFE